MPLLAGDVCGRNARRDGGALQPHDALRPLLLPLREPRDPAPSVDGAGRGLERALASILGLAALLLLAACGRAAPTQRVVLVTLDTLRFDAFTGSGNVGAMPRTRALLRDGTFFVRAYAATSCTQPTHASIFTGRHPWQHGVTRNGMVLAASEETLAERLHAAGFRTAAVVAAFPLHPRFGFDQGFDVYDAALDRDLGSAYWEGTDVEGASSTAWPTR